MCSVVIRNSWKEFFKKWYDLPQVYLVAEKFWQIFASSIAENLIAILQARDGFSLQNQSSPLRGPECCSYNSHGSSIQESPSERESQIYNLWCVQHCFPHIAVSSLMWPYFTYFLTFPCSYSGLSEHTQYELHLSWVRQWVGGVGQCFVELSCRAQKGRHQRDAVKGLTALVLPE